LEKKEYEAAGKIIAYGIVHRGPLPRFFSKTLYHAITEGYSSADPDVSDIDDPSLQEILQKASIKHLQFVPT